nr:response regulator transcription factor [Tessaracoccus coleopterorum]
MVCSDSPSGSALSAANSTSPAIPDLGAPRPDPTAPLHGGDAFVTKNEGDPIRVLLADDDAIVRSALRAHLSSSPDIRVVAEAITGQEALRLLDSGLDVDVVLMDVRMPEKDGISAAAEIGTRSRSRPRVLLVTSYDTDEIVVEALRARSNGLVLKSAGPRRCQMPCAPSTVGPRCSPRAPSRDLPTRSRPNLRPTCG